MESAHVLVVPTIEESIQCLKDHLLSCSNNDQGVSSQLHVAKVYMSSMHVLCTIKHEQQQIAAVRSNFVRRHKEVPSDIAVEHQIPFPSPDVIPTIDSMLRDPVLFHVLLRCLSTSTSFTSQSKVVTSDPSIQQDSSVATSLAKIPTATNLVDHSVPTSSRKRSLSISVDGPTMNAKMHSFGTSPKINPALRGTLLHNSHPVHPNKPMFNIPILVATIMYSVLEYFDHWPAPLVQMYADDCFGPRSWVEHKVCVLLTKNLALLHNDRIIHSDADCNDVVDSTDASIMADTYRAYWNVDMEASVVNQKPKLASSTTNKAGSTMFGMFTTLAHRNKSSEHPGLKRQRTGSRTFGNTMPNDSDTEDDSVSVVHSNTEMIASEGDDSSSQVALADQQSSSGDYIRKRKLDRATISSRSLESQDSNDDCQRTLIDQSRPKFLISVSANTSLQLSSESGMEVGKITHDIYRYPVKQVYLSSERIRNRYHGKNMEAAHDAIITSLKRRLDTKSKQNSSLLQCLPSFMGIPGVRKLVATNLEKWLQSPALAGLARTLFTSIVNHIKIVDPPLLDDLDVINSIVGMNLKANQLNAHIESISAIAKKLPKISVIIHLYSTLLKQLMELATFNATEDQLKMITAIHRVVPPTLSYDAIASVILMLLLNPAGVTSGKNVPLIMDRHVQVEKLRRFLRVLAVMLGPLFDGSSLVQSLLSFQVNSNKWTFEDEEDKARLMLQCATLSIASLMSDSYQSGSDALKVTTTIRTVRKLMLTYCCTEYGPHFRCKGPLKRIDYFQSGFGKSENENTIPSWLTTMRCLLFIEPPESPQMKRFFSRSNDTMEDISEWEQELPRIRACYKYGSEVNNDLIWIVLNSTSVSPGIDAEMAIRLLENLLERCCGGKTIALTINDPKIVWELYNLVLFEPENQTMKLNFNLPDDDTGTTLVPNELPRLALPGLWWRVTMIALVFCASSPEKIGLLVWRDHPTIRAIIKMVTSQRFRFPTVDCDDATKIEMKKMEYAAREEERRIAEALYLPPNLERKQNIQKGARVSRRILKQQQEKDAANELTEARRRKALLDVAQKSIMLWDPDGPARKPPPESVDMLLVVNDRFHLSLLFQHCLEPDYLLMSIGQTTRGAIERAYNWLIPIVSSLPEAISRLPSSASCLLLLQAYSTQGEERKQLKELSAPLLQHVTNSLCGRYGELHALKAFDLLMADMASTQTDKRRCARKVLQDSLIPAESFKSTQSLFACMLQVLQLEHAKLLVNDAVKHMVRAVGLEKGAILPALIMALQNFIDFADSHNNTAASKFPVVLVQLLTTRPLICAEAMDSDLLLYELTIKTLYSEFSKCATEYLPSCGDGAIVSLSLYNTSIGEGEIKVPLQLLQSICVALNVWKNQAVCDNSILAMQNFIDALLHCDSEDSGNSNKGLASATSLDGNILAITMEDWMMLAKARRDDIARRAALSIPVNFLPRLLLCSGLPRIAVLAIIQRLGHLAGSAIGKHEISSILLETPTFSGCDVTYLENSRDITGQLLSRVSAYFRMYKISLSTPNLFLSKLLAEHEFSQTIATIKGTQKKIQGTSNAMAVNMNSVTSIFSELSQYKISPLETNDNFAP